VVASAVREDEKFMKAVQHDLVVSEGPLSKGDCLK
jgi:hypothetical protein